jgi:hypothetical protein
MEVSESHEDGADGKFVYRSNASTAKLGRSACGIKPLVFEPVDLIAAWLTYWAVRVSQRPLGRVPSWWPGGIEILENQTSRFPSISNLRLLENRDSGGRER